MNYCLNCIRKEKKSPPSQCPECGTITLYAELIGASMCLNCTNCGFEIIGSSFFPQCYLDNELDDNKYTISIHTAEKAQYLRIAKAFGINTVQLKKNLDSGKGVHKCDLPLEPIVDIMLMLRDAGVEYLVTPDPREKYPEILDCKLR